jgi:hypothetical protein
VANSTQSVLRGESEWQPLLDTLKHDVSPCISPSSL